MDIDSGGDQDRINFLDKNSFKLLKILTEATGEETPATAVTVEDEIEPGDEPHPHQLETSLLVG